MSPSREIPPADEVAARSQGLAWDDLAVGTKARTLRRTITESDLVGFVTSMGFFEQIFLDAHDETYGGERRLVPGLLTCAIAEGLVLQTQIIQGTGLALLSMTLRMVAPVFVGDTIRVDFEVTESRRASRGDRGVVTFRNTVLNQQDELVLDYEATRLISGRTATGPVTRGAR